MKRYLVLFALSILGICNLVAKDTDSIVYDLGNYKISLKGNTYCIESNSGKILFQNLKYVGSANQFWQILDEKNQVFYLNQEMKKSEIKDNFIGVCGTVPHYDLKIRSNKNEFQIWIDETFYDYGNEIPAEIKLKIPKSQADEVYFINGKTQFNYDGNYGIGGLMVQPDLIIFKKNGKYGIWQDPTKTMYDKIEFQDLNLKITKDGKVGYYGFTKIKYDEIQPFIYNLARIKSYDGKSGYVDAKGKEYFD